MLTSNRTTWTLRASVATLLYAALITTTGAMAASPKLQTIDVTPAAKTISVSQKQTFTATGTFSDGSKQVLGPAISDIAPGGINTCALLTSGSVECWGYNANGELGNGNNADSLIPVPVKGIKTAKAVVANGDDGCAVLASGTVQCWGRNDGGQLGNGTNVDSNTPVFVKGIATATAVTLAGSHSCALLASGSVQCWGYNPDGALGDGSNTNSNVPVNVIGISTAIALASGSGEPDNPIGSGHTCALLASGEVQCWGDNVWGGLGNGTRTNSNTPVTVSGISNATAIASGQLNDWNCALLASGAVQCWGGNQYGHLGNGSNDWYSATPVTVTGISTAIAITAGAGHACAVLRSGSVQCWGFDKYGQLGNGTTTKNSNTPVLVHEIYAPTKLAAGEIFTCALFSGGMMRCWGNNQYGELGNRRKSYASSLPVTVVGTPGVVWKSSNTTRATVTDRGVATGRAAGNTTITATTAGFINDNALLTVK